MSECVRIANWFVQTFNFASFAKKVTIEVCFQLLAVCLSQLISIPKGFTTYSFQHKNFIENTVEGCVFEKKKKNKNQNEKGIESNISQS